MIKSQSMALRAVLTADIVNSTKLKTATEKGLVKVLHGILSFYRFEFYRGDSFQVFIKDPRKALKVAVLCRMAAISASQKAKENLSDVRISIGIGTVTMPIKTLGTARGEAFVLSGRAFDELSKTGDRLSVSSSNNLANSALKIMSDYLNAILKGITGKQAQVIFELLNGQTQQEVSVRLKKSKSTVHQHVVSGRWNEIETLLKQYEDIINQLI